MLAWKKVLINGCVSYKGTVWIENKRRTIDKQQENFTENKPELLVSRTIDRQPENMTEKKHTTIDKQ